MKRLSAKVISNCSQFGREILQSALHQYSVTWLIFKYSFSDGVCLFVAAARQFSFPCKFSPMDPIKVCPTVSVGGKAAV
jgi:hypothetical protein